MKAPISGTTGFRTLNRCSTDESQSTLVAVESEREVFSSWTDKTDGLKKMGGWAGPVRGVTQSLF